MLINYALIRNNLYNENLPYSAILYDKYLIFIVFIFIFLNLKLIRT